MTVKARLEGHDFDLEVLAKLFSEGEPRVSKGEDGFYYLSSGELDSLMDSGGQLMEVGAAVLQRVNGVARAIDSSFRPVTLSGHFIDGDDDKKRHHVVAVETAEVRARAQIVAVRTNNSDSSPLPPLPAGAGYIRLAQNHSDVAEVIEILGRAGVNIGWVDLYKIYEVIRHSAGGEAKLKMQPWARGFDFKAFTGSANRPDVSGREARHARMSGYSPKRTMTLAEGQNFIRNLIIAWWNAFSNET